MPSLIGEPRPPLVTDLAEDPYSDPSNPPLDPEHITGYCGMQWIEHEAESVAGNKNYLLRNFTTEQEVIDAGFNITHKGHCGVCSSLQVVFKFFYK